MSTNLSHVIQGDDQETGNVVHELLDLVAANPGRLVHVEQNPSLGEILDEARIFVSSPVELGLFMFRLPAFLGVGT